MRGHVFQRGLQEVNQDGLEYIRWNTAKYLWPNKQQPPNIKEIQHLADFGRLSGNFLHEITNPLAAASLHLEMCEVKSNKALREVRKNLILMERYVKAARSQLKTTSSRDSFIVRDEIIQSLPLLKPMANRLGVTLNFPSVDRNLRIHGDAVKFDQIFANLVANAIDAYAEVETNNKVIDVITRVRGRFIHIYVHDRGKGISPDQLPELFKPFYTTKNATGRGLGIGLSIVKRMVEEDFNGYIYATSSKSQGTTFSAKLMMRPPIRKIAGGTLRVN